MDKKEKELIKTFSVRCPKCNIVFDDRNETHFKTSNLPILLYSMKRIVFECINCKHHIPVKFVSAFNIVHLKTNESLIGENKNVKKEY